MAQLKSTNIYGTLAVTDSISEGGSTLESKYLGIASKASSAATADSASSVPWSGHIVLRLAGICSPDLYHLYA